MIQQPQQSWPRPESASTKSESLGEKKKKALPSWALNSANDDELEEDNDHPKQQSLFD